jgi:hypothetical protein
VTEAVRVRVIICGSPQWTYDEIVKDEIVRLRRECRFSRERLLVIHGGEPGPETVAKEYCRKLGIDTMIQEAVRVLGQSSYFRRNELMLSYHRPELVVGFALSFNESAFVSDMMKRAEKRGIKTRAVDYESIVRRNNDDITPIRRV